MLPNFLIVGAMRSGTTYLHRVLSQHPQIYLPNEKELHYFSRHYAKYSDIDLEEYSTHFAEATSTHIAIGEASPEYMYVDWVPNLIKKYLGNIKVIFVLRDPVKRAYSHYMWAIKGGHVEDLPFKKAIHRQLYSSISNFDNYRHNTIYSYVERGFYYQQIQNYLSYFPRENMYFVIFEELVSEPQSVLEDLQKFLGVDVLSLEERKFTNRAEIPKNIRIFRYLTYLRCLVKSNKKQLRGGSYLLRFIKKIQENYPRTKKYPKMDKEVEDYLYHLYQEPNEQLSKFLGRELPW